MNERQVALTQAEESPAGYDSVRAVRVDAASRPGAAQSDNQDRYGIGSGYTFVLDGASHPDPDRRAQCSRYVGALARSLTRRLDCDRGGDLRRLLKLSIEAVAPLSKGGMLASSTVAIARWSTAHVEVVILGDSPAAVLTTSGVEHVRDTRLSQVCTDERAAIIEALARGEGYGEAHNDRVRQLTASELEQRNRPLGYWIAADDPMAASHSFHRIWPLAQMRALMLATDGLSDGVDHVAESWDAAFKVADAFGVQNLIDRVHLRESEDPTGVRWPRFKPHDDKTGVLVVFDGL